MIRLFRYLLPANPMQAALAHMDAAIADIGSLTDRIQTDNAALREELAPTQGAVA